MYITSGTAPSSAHATRLPSYAWTIIAFPATSAASYPVVTDTVPLALPDESDVYPMLVHGSVETE